VIDFLRTHTFNLLFFVAIIATFAAIERVRPVTRQPVRAAFFNVALFAAVYRGLFLYYYEIARTLNYVQDWRHARLGVADFADRDLGPLGFAVRFLLFAFIADLIKYWMHRAMHSVPFLWRFHRAHHSDRHFNASTHVREQ
jgi:sterol desaturase/sphingolipid hydroxylase (fatty acid hydroxylase superfamily)